MPYHYSKLVTVSNAPEPCSPGMAWVKGRPQYLVRSDAGAMSTRNEDAATLTEARRIAKKRARACGWAEIFRWAENGTTLRKFFVAEYEREVQA